MQKVQNRGTRFILNTKLKDKISSKWLHEKLKVNPVNVRLNKLTKKMYKTMDLYTSTNNPVEPLYKLSDYVTETQPHRTKKQTIARRVQTNIFTLIPKPRKVFYI